MNKRKDYVRVAVLISTAIALTHARAASPSIPAWTERGAGVLRDNATGLEWTQTDNGQDVDWKTADSFCAGKKAGWRLPAVEELERVYMTAASRSDSTTCGQDTCRVPGLFKLSGEWFWSATRSGSEKDDGRALFWGVLMVNGVRTQGLADFDYGSRALCVRPS